MTTKDKLQRLTSSPWFIALIFLGVFFITTGYKYGWDDQHLEIPLLKSLIDNELYQGDYYVESLKKNFSSYFYPVLARFITIDQIPTAYFILYLVSRYFLFFWIYKLWLWITRNPFQAVMCLCMFMIVDRTDEFLYRTFSHQEFALAIIFAGIYYFFKERFILSSIFLGVATNIHAIYSLFPFTYMAVYLLWQIKKYGWKTLVKASLSYILFSLPFLVWFFGSRFAAIEGSAETLYQDWLSLFVIACPQNFIFWKEPLISTAKLFENITTFFHITQTYLLIFALFILNIIFNTSFKANKKAVAFCFSALAYLLVCFVFTYIYPYRLILDLNLVRNIQFLLFLLLGFTMIYIVENVEKRNFAVGYIFALLLFLFKFSGVIEVLAVCITFFISLIMHALENKKKAVRILLCSLSVPVIGICLYTIIRTFLATPYTPAVKISLFVSIALLTVTYFAHFWLTGEGARRCLKKVFLIIPITVFLVQFGIYHYHRHQIEYTGIGFWRLQRSWEDMQKYVKTNTPKDAVVLVPHDMEMGGFRIHSERQIICSYRDCGIIGFDYEAAVKWQKRLNDIKDFKVLLKESPLASLTTAILKYKVDYIVFMRYAKPKERHDLFELLYTNDDFVLYKVYRHPVFDRIPFP